MFFKLGQVSKMIGDRSLPVRLRCNPVCNINGKGAYKIVFRGEKYDTAWQAFLVHCFQSGDVRESIRDANSLFEAEAIARRQGFDTIVRLQNTERRKFLLEEVFRALFQQHSQLLELLKLTGSGPIVVCFYRGDLGGNIFGEVEHVGANELGQVLTRLRAELTGV